MSKHTFITPRKGGDSRKKPRYKLAASIRRQEAKRLKQMADEQKQWRELQTAKRIQEQLLTDALMTDPFEP